MRVLTFGWDFPPKKNGGLGVACFGLTRELTEEGVEVLFVLPKSQEVTGSPRFIFADTERLTKVIPVDASIQPYASSDTMVEATRIIDETTGREKTVFRRLVDEVHRFAHKASLIARQEEFDVIHAHDWTSYLAGVAAKVASGKPLILHVHATSFDQAASNNVDPEVFKIEQEAFAAADRVVTVSNFTRNMIIDKHGVDPAKVEVVHNGCDAETIREQPPTLEEFKQQGKKIVLYVGRITIQKGVDHFVWAARRVVDLDPNVIFVIVGRGDMSTQIMNQVGALGLSSHFIFTGDLWEDDRDRLMQAADLVVMPSVSEPFGLVPLEALQLGTPSLISKQSGVSEVLTHALKVDFWDTEEMANKIISSLRYPAVGEQIAKEGQGDLSQLSWRHAAVKVRDLYQRLIQYAA